MSRKDAKKGFFALKKRGRRHIGKKTKQSPASLPLAIGEATCEAWEREPRWRSGDPLRMAELAAGKDLGPW